MMNLPRETSILYLTGQKETRESSEYIILYAHAVIMIPCYFISLHNFPLRTSSLNVKYLIKLG